MTLVRLVERVGLVRVGRMMSRLRRMILTVPALMVKELRWTLSPQ